MINQKPPNNLYHIDWHFNEYEDPVVRLYTTDDDGYRLPVQEIPLPVKPYFLAYSDIAQNMNLPSIIEIEDVPFTYQGKKLLKINTPSPSVVPRIRQLIGITNTFEADVPYNRRVMIDLDWRVQLPKKWLFIDIETDPTDGIPDEQQALKRILSIAVKTNDGQEYFYSDRNETQLIRDCLAFIDKYPVICTFNGNNFDWPYLINRCRILDIEYEWYNHIHIDLRAVYKFILLIQRDMFSLEHIADKEELPTRKRKINIKDLLYYFEHDINTLKEYNLDDVRIIYDLDKKWNMVHIVFNIANITHTNVRDLMKVHKQNKKEFNNSVAVDGLILRLSVNRKERVIWPTKQQYEDDKDEREEKYEGAMVLNPIPGVHNNIAVLDVNALYPTIVMSFNIGPETYRDDNIGDIKSPIGRGSFVSTPKSVFSEGLSYVLKTRNEWREKKMELSPTSDEYIVADATYNAYKVLANSIYGVIGSFYSRYFNKDIAENITLTGQMVIKFLDETLQSMNIRVIGGDTDSVFLQLPDLDIDKAKDLANKLTAETKNYLHAISDIYPSHFKLDIDKLCSVMYVPANIQGKGTKKKYVARMTWRDGPTNKLLIKGFEIVRHDTSEAKRQAQQEVLEKILDGYTIEQLYQYTEEYWNKLASGALDQQLVMYKALGKHADDYEVLPAHLRAARILEEQGKLIMHRGEKIGFIKTGKKPENILPIADDTIIQLTVEQYRYIWNSQFVPMFKRLGILIEKKSDEPKEKTKQMDLSTWM